MEKRHYWNHRSDESNEEECMILIHNISTLRARKLFGCLSTNHQRKELCWECSFKQGALIQNHWRRRFSRWQIDKSTSAMSGWCIVKIEADGIYSRRKERLLRFDNDKCLDLQIFWISWKKPMQYNGLFFQQVHNRYFLEKTTNNQLIHLQNQQHRKAVKHFPLKNSGRSWLAQIRPKCWKSSVFDFQIVRTLRRRAFWKLRSATNDKGWIIDKSRRKLTKAAERDQPTVCLFLYNVPTYPWHDHWRCSGALPCHASGYRRIYILVDVMFFSMWLFPHCIIIDYYQRI